VQAALQAMTLAELAPRKALLGIESKRAASPALRS
jgi:hypothetical protein